MTDPISTPAQMREAAALLATSFLVGDPQNGVPLRNPMAHEIAAAIRALPVAEQQAIRDRALDDAAQAASNRAAYWWDEATAADDTGRTKLSLSYEAKALACTELAAAIRAMKGTTE